MRVIDTSTYQISSGEQTAFRTEGYAILSHRWVGVETTYEQISQQSTVTELRKSNSLSPQLQKIRGACRIARQLGLRWIWIDSCCINKANSVEETESINSMFRWYRDATVCITYLSDVKVNLHEADKSSAAIFNSTHAENSPSVWFQRGWTLQELLAPRIMKFYDARWQYMGTKSELARPLQLITGIKESYLTGEENFREASVAAKMSWMAGRETSRIEDIAYSMLGIFNVHMNPQYGEGMRAFRRLQQELLASTTDESIFAWKKPLDGPAAHIKASGKVAFAEDEWGLLAASPEWFRYSGNVTVAAANDLDRPLGGYSITGQGVAGPIPENVRQTSEFVAGLTLVGVVPYLAYKAVRVRQDNKFILNCLEPDDKGKLRSVRIYLRVVSRSPRIFVRTRCHEYDLVRSGISQDATLGIVCQPNVENDEY
jgi:hypothetical protein